MSAVGNIISVTAKGAALSAIAYGIAQLVEPASTTIPRYPDAAQRVSVSKSPLKVRDGRPEAAPLTQHVATNGFHRWTVSDEEVQVASEPIRVETSALYVLGQKALARAATSGRKPEAAGRKPTGWVEVTGSVVNVRSGPSAEALRLGSLRRGTRVRVLDRAKNWMQIEDDQSGARGWMHGNYLSALPDIAGQKATEVQRGARG